MAAEGKEKKKVNPKRVHMAEQPAEERVKNFREVPLGYTEDEAAEEARRCLQCKKPACSTGCPVEIDIPAFISLVAEKKFAEAAKKIKETNSLPAVCGRVCPQEIQCESRCVVGKKGEPVAIGRLERFVADWEREKGKVEPPPRPRPKHKKVAVIGSGPAGLTVASDLAKLGYAVTLFEALHKTGGVLVYGIPEFRLPKAIVQAEVDFVESLGVEIKTNALIGTLYTVPELMQKGYEAVFIGIGAGGPMFMNIPGEALNGVYSANEFLTRSNLMKAYLFPAYDTPIKKSKKVAVVGAGNVAMDSVRTAIRLGAEEVYLVYRRSEQEMPARIEEIERAKEEGALFKLLTNPVRILGDDKGWVTSMECIRMELGEPDDSGRRRPVPVKGSEFIIEVDSIIMALGTNANPLLPQSTPGLKLNKWGYIMIDEETCGTSIRGVYAGGDIVTGSATVILAMGAGRKAARAIDKYLSGTV
ncbi:MAG: glutamate synthase [Deltaproteobacteria bacterium]|nr:glutamate synthase [Deltaproteobacteria bacterium]